MAAGLAGLFGLLGSGEARAAMITQVGEGAREFLQESRKGHFVIPAWCLGVKKKKNQKDEPAPIEIPSAIVLGGAFLLGIYVLGRYLGSLQAIDIDKVKELWGVRLAAAVMGTSAAALAGIQNDAEGAEEEGGPFRLQLWHSYDFGTRVAYLQVGGFRKSTTPGQMLEQASGLKENWGWQVTNAVGAKVRGPGPPAWASKFTGGFDRENIYDSPSAWVR